MVQEMNILRCYSCRTFQVHIVKKANKWQCKICNEKQSIQHVYYQGTGQECRLQVQHLNYKRHDKEREALRELEKIEFTEEQHHRSMSVIEQPTTTHSKWDKYMIPQKRYSETELNEDIGVGSTAHYKESTSNGTNAFEDNSEAMNYNFSDEKSIDEEIRNKKDEDPSSSSNCSNDLIEKNQNIVIIRRHVKRKPDIENVVPESQASGSSLDVMSKRSKLVDETSFRRQSILNLVGLNRFKIAKSSREAMKQSLNNMPDKLILGEIENNVTEASETEISKLNVKRKAIFETDCDDLDDILDF